MAENKLHVVDDFESAGLGCCVPSVAMLIKFFLEDVIRFNLFYFQGGNLYVKDDEIISGLEYDINDDGEFVVTDTEEVYTVIMNNNKELEVTK